MSIKITGMTKAQKAILNKAQETAGKVALAVDGAVVLATPVDTGRARSNWIPTLNNPAQSELPETVVDKTGSLPIATLTNLVNSGHKSSRYFITNNVPYIERLNEGHSKQNTTGYVQRAVKNATAPFK